jgi:hypothetical protein
MAKSLSQILGYVTLTGTIQATTRGIPNPFPESFMTKTQDVVGNKGKYTRFTGQRKVARLNKYGGPAHKRNLMPVGEVDIKLLHSFENISLDPLLMKALRSYDSYEQDRGIREVGRQIAELGQLYQNLRIATTAQVLGNGSLYWDGDGNLLPSSSGAIETHSFQVNANNQNQLNGIITASWALPATDIPLQLRNLKKRAAQLTGYPLKYAFYGENIPTYLTQNDYVLDYLSRNPSVNPEFLQSAEMGDLFGLTWVPVYTAFFEDQSDTNQAIWGADKVVFTPEVSADWWEVIEGSYEVPKTIDIIANADSAMGSMDTVYGMFSYAKAEHNPPTMGVYMGDTQIPVLKVPDAIFQADVTP